MLEKKKEYGMRRRGFMKSVGMVTVVGSVLWSIGLLISSRAWAQPQHCAGLIFVVDGTGYTEKDFSKEQAIEVPHIVVTKDELMNCKVYGFYNRKDMEIWLAEHGYIRNYRIAEKIIEDVKKEADKLTPEERKEISEAQAQESKDAKQRFEDELKKNNIPLNDIDKITNHLKSQRGSLRGPKHTGYLNNGLNFTGGWFVANWGVPYYNLIGFDNVTRSAMTTGFIQLLLCDVQNFGGRCIRVMDPDTVVEDLRVYPYYFDRKASSAYDL